MNTFWAGALICLLVCLVGVGFTLAGLLGVMSMDMANAQSVACARVGSVVWFVGAFIWLVRGGFSRR